MRLLALLIIDNSRFLAVKENTYHHLSLISQEKGRNASNFNIWVSINERKQKTNKQTWVIENKVSFKWLHFNIKGDLHHYLKNCQFVMKKTQLLFYIQLFYYKNTNMLIRQKVLYNVQDVVICDPTPKN